MRLTEPSSSRTQWHKHNKFPAPNGTRFHRTNQPETCHTWYDANGNMISDQNGSTYVFDAWNRLVEVKNAAGAVIAQYTYDARGYRIAESYPQGGSGVPAGTTNYIYYDANWQAIETRTNGTAASNVTSQMVWSAAYINAAVLQDSYSGGVIQPNSRLYFTQDANWDTTAVIGYDSTTQTWGVVQRYVYSPYGTITVLNADWSTPPTGTQPLVNNLYQGMTLDAVTGLYYERNRDYSPSLGRWMEQDPAQFINGANTYQFVDSSPVGNVDAEGLRLVAGEQGFVIVKAHAPETQYAMPWFWDAKWVKMTRNGKCYSVPLVPMQAPERAYIQDYRAVTGTAGSEPGSRVGLFVNTFNALGKIEAVASLIIKQGAIAEFFRMGVAMDGLIAEAGSLAGKYMPATYWAPEGTPHWTTVWVDVGKPIVDWANAKLLTNCPCSEART